MSKNKNIPMTVGRFPETFKMPEIMDGMPGMELLKAQIPARLSLFDERAAALEEDPSSFDWVSIKAFFPASFVDTKLNEDLCFVLRDILSNRQDEFCKYASSLSSSVLINVKSLTVDLLFITLSALLEMAFDGDSYARELLISLYKTYFKKEYRAVKRFKVIDCVRDLLSIVGPPEEGNEIESLGNVSRVVIYCRLMNIELKNTASTFEVFDSTMEMTRKQIEDLQKDAAFYLPGRDEIEACMEYVKDVVSPLDENALAERMSIYKSVADEILCLTGVTDRGSVILDDHPLVTFCAQVPYALSLANMHGHSLEDMHMDLNGLAAMAVLTHTLNIACSMVKAREQDIEVLCGISEDYHKAEFMPEFSPVKAPDKVRKCAPAKPVPEKRAVPVQVPMPSEKEKGYLEQIADLEERLREKDTSLKNLKAIHEQQRSRIAELEKAVEKANGHLQEMAQMKEFIKRLDEEEKESSEEHSPTIEEMKKALSDMKIVIVGGNENWRKKLRNIFPNWNFIYTHNRPLDYVKYCDHAFFFTDSVSHGMYFRNLREFENKHIPVSIIHGVELNRNIRYIYMEAVEKKKGTQQ